MFVVCCLLLFVKEETSVDISTLVLSSTLMYDVTCKETTSKINCK